MSSGYCRCRSESADRNRQRHDVVRSQWTGKRFDVLFDLFGFWLFSCYVAMWPKILKILSHSLLLTIPQYFLSQNIGIDLGIVFLKRVLLTTLIHTGLLTRLRDKLNLAATSLYTDDYDRNKLFFVLIVSECMTICCMLQSIQ